jgi:Arc/MetJ-type ribon-helix-helix transcriptional regulator
MTERITISVPDELADQINARLSYGDNRSEWIREAIEQRLGDRGAHNEPDTDDGVRDQLRDQLAEELPGSGDVLDARVEAVLKMYAVLRDRGAASKSELLEVVDVKETGYASAESVWSNMIKGRDSLRALPGVETPATGRSTWHYSDN